MRPTFHFTASGWLNDPHAVTVVDGRYHLFFQHVPDARAWDIGIHWGHAVGDDLLSLTERAPALAPGDGDAGIWSGDLLVDDAGRATIFYTAVDAENPARGRVRTATPLDDEWLEWEKGEVVATAPDGVDVFRDPTLLRDGDSWRMLVGAGLPGGVAGALGYVSDDGRHWRPDGVALERAGSERMPLWSGTMWECPQILRVGERHVFVTSVWEDDVLYDVVAAVGDFEDGRFHPRGWNRLSYGPAPYAATTFLDASGEPCIMFWLRGVEGSDWAGAHSFPYRLGLDGDQPTLALHPDLDRYHAPATTSVDAADILWRPDAASAMTISGSHGSVIVLQSADGLLHIEVDGETWAMPGSGEIRVTVDGPILEVSSSRGVFATPIRPLGRGWRTDASNATVRALRAPARTSTT